MSEKKSLDLDKVMSMRVNKGNSSLINTDDSKKIVYDLEARKPLFIRLIDAIVGSKVGLILCCCCKT